MEAVKKHISISYKFIVSVGLHFTIIMHFNHCVAQDFNIVVHMSTGTCIVSRITRKHFIDQLCQYGCNY